MTWLYPITGNMLTMSKNTGLFSPVFLLARPVQSHEQIVSIFTTLFTEQNTIATTFSCAKIA